MKTILKPTSYLKLGEIVIETYPFLIGRHEAAFNTCKDYIFTPISKRHARIFEEQGDVYLIDLGSLNGTMINGKSIRGKAVKLSQGDEIRFAEQLVFKVIIKGRFKSVRKPQSYLHLTLIPEQQEVHSEPIEVTDFPFLINEVNGKFRGYQENFPEEVRRLIPRAHALIALRDGNVYLEDLGNSGGTLVAGVLLKEASALLRDGDYIAFGKEQCKYSVKLENRRVASDQAVKEIMLISHQQPKPDIDVNKTTFVSTANPFLDILYAQSANELVKPKDADEPQARPVKLAKHEKIRALLAQFKNTIVNNKPINLKKIWLTVSIGALLLLTAVGVYFKGAPEREAKNLLIERRYAESAAVANRYLQKHASDKQISALATEALAKYVVPKWMAKLEQKAFAEADQLLAQAMMLSQFNVDGQKMLGLLGWIDALEKLATERGSAGHIVIFNHEAKMQALLEQWDQNADDHRRLLDRIVGYVPSFEEVRSRSFSRLHMLRSDESGYLKNIENLKATIRDKLRDDRGEDLTVVLKEFKERYPVIEGIEGLEEDLEHFLTIQEAIRVKNIPKVLRTLGTVTFTTPPFQEKVKEWIAKELPSTDIAEAYLRASDAWRVGATSEAITILEPLTRQVWGEVATRTLERYKRVTADFTALQAMKSDKDYGERLLAFHNSLDSVEDAFFLNAIKADFQRYKEKALSNAEESFRLARQRWNEYRENGGIGGLLQLEAAVSKTFRQQAQRLVGACNYLTSGTRIYDVLQLDYPREGKALNDQIRSEIRLQRQSLSNLNTVLSPALLRTKLDLLTGSQGCDQ